MTGDARGRARPTLRAALRAAVRGIERVETALCAASITGFTLLVAANVVLRYAFGRPIDFAEEVSVVLMIWMSLLAASLALGRGEMVAVTLLVDALPDRAGDLVRRLAGVLVLAVALTLAWASVTWLRSPSSTRDVVVTLGIAKWYPYLIVPVFFGLVSLKTLVALVARTPEQSR